MFNNIYANKKVLVTGNTGFKGSWLTAWLLQMGAKVFGISKDIPTNPSLFEVLDLNSKITYYQQDIRDFEKVKKIIDEVRPDFIFHLAAQPIVSYSYENPLETLSSNVLGTANILECLRVLNFPCTAVMITSDKCYDNVEWVWGYKETDALGGKDIYSGSKGAAELVCKSYFHSFFKRKTSKVRIATARAGNVIGGGDWALDRIVPDCMLSWNEGRAVEIRSPQATRPWQHVLEPLSGYLQLGAELAENPELNGDSFNFGPKSENSHTVVQLLKDLSKVWKIEENSAYIITDNITFHEAGLLKLNCDKALFHLKWTSTLDYQTLIKFTGEWYHEFYKETENIFDLTISQIAEYQNIAKKLNLKWTN
ncbi:MAG: CDP-glucose 4,6-dehydratase [Prevotellaceae bacterium]|jgi:CDP-glucose 4,6-dehydratase|nr:CDP-glucose 4,6-dehydratase [Prevotellaceae bacterium]